MEIINKSRKAVLASGFSFCDDVLSKAFGLMFSKKPVALVFVFKKEKIVPLHMLFVFFPIDVLFLDKNKKVVEIKENLRPFAFYNPGKKAKFVVELPKGVVKKSKTKVGDLIGFEG